VLYTQAKFSTPACSKNLSKFQYAYAVGNVTQHDIDELVDEAYAGHVECQELLASIGMWSHE
jgi:hypothetical protein